MVRRAKHLGNLAPAAGLVVLVALTGAPSRAEDYAACAKFENPLAYNQCLAAHGPPAHGTRAIAPPPEGEDRPWGARAAHGHGGETLQASRARNGRMVLEFSIGPASAGSQRPKKTP
jgi:hypothetical protein